MNSNRTPYPTSTGTYMWFIWDMNYTKIGLVDIVVDKKSHVDWLRSRPPLKSKGFHLYQGGFQNMVTYTMYHQAQDNLPPCDEDGRPHVDGYMPFDMRLLLEFSAIVQVKAQALPEMSDEDKKRLVEKCQNIRNAQFAGVLDEKKVVDYRGGVCDTDDGHCACGAYHEKGE